MDLKIFLPPAKAPQGYEYTAEARAAMQLSKIFGTDEFHGIPLSFPLLPAFNQQFMEGWTQDARLLSPASQMRQLARQVLFPAMWRARRARTGIPQEIPRGGLLVRIEAAEMKKQWSLISGILPHLRKLPVWLLCGDKQVPPHCLSSGFSTMPNDVILDGALAEFSSAYFPRLVRWNRTLRRGLATLGLPPQAAFRFSAVMGETLMAGVQAQAILKETRPKMIVVDCDHHPISVWLIFFAKQLGIPTVTLQHGTLADLLFYLPLWADQALIWGEEHARTFSDFGADNDRLHIVGCPRVDSSVLSGADTSRAAAILEIPPGNRVVMLATSRELDVDRFRLARMALDAVHSCPGHTLLIKCHPTEDSAFYRAAFGTEDDVKIVSDSELGLPLALALADVVLTQWSGVTGDAMLKGKPVILLDLGQGLMSNQKILDAEACLAAHDARGLAALLKEETYSRHRNAPLHERAEAYIRTFYAAHGEEAAQLTAAALQELWQRACASPQTIGTVH